jgi:ABC-type amino acid transport substrate-binding protein
LRFGHDNTVAATYNRRMTGQQASAFIGARTLLPTVVALLLALSGGGVLAAPSPADPAGDDGANRPLIVALAESPPFVMKDDDGTWSGLSVDLWREVAAQLGVRWEPREVALDQIDRVLHDEQVDVALGAIPVDAEGETQHDYSQPYYVTGLGFAERARDELSWRAALAVLSNSEFVHVVALIAAATLAVGILIAFIERKHEAGEFGGPLRRSIGTGIWWAAVTMTTVGYGDATPKTASGRSVALVWMFVGVAVVAIFTATVTSILTLGSLRGTVRHAAELAQVRAGAVAGGAGEVYLRRRHITYTPFESYDDGLAALAEGRIDALVANAPSLRYLARQWQGVIHVSPIVLEPLWYTIGLPTGSPWRESIDRAVLQIIAEDRWRDVEQRYFGHV